MNLNNDSDLFEKIILEASNKLKINPIFIEKDYYVTLFLKQLSKIQTNLVFKGGTSLSKCYRLIDRFSEDIDISIETVNKPNLGEKRSLIKNIKDTIDRNGFKLINKESILNRRDYNRFEIKINTIFNSNFIKRDLIIEYSLFIKTYPNNILLVSSYIYDYLKSIDRSDLIELYELQPFLLKVQSKERTFIDKLFAVCDYYLRENIHEHSRHLYDLYMLSETIEINNKLIDLIHEVKELRKNNKTCLSAKENINFIDVFIELLNNDAYKDDYKSITSLLIFKPVNYETIKSKLLYKIHLLKITLKI